MTAPTSSMMGAATGTGFGAGVALTLTQLLPPGSALQQATSILLPPFVAAVSAHVLPSIYRETRIIALRWLVVRSIRRDLEELRSLPPAQRQPDDDKELEQELREIRTASRKRMSDLLARLSAADQEAKSRRAPLKASEPRERDRLEDRLSGNKLRPSDSPPSSRNQRAAE